MKLRKFEIALLCGLIIALLCGASLRGQQRQLSDKLIRLHVRANSDSAEDQELKLLVRDLVLKEAEDIAREAPNREAAFQELEARLERFESLAEELLSSRDCGYEVKAGLEMESFPTREYEGFTLPAGRYMSLRVDIGEARGQNWWCVVFPPLCLAAAGEDFAGSAMAVGLTEGETALILAENEGYVLKLKSMEIINSIVDWFN